MRYFAIVQYDGTNFSGWQVQPGKRTVELEIEIAISRILDTPTKIYGSGRTDAGVHAIGQTFHFDGKGIADVDKFKYSLNQILPGDIYIKSLSVVADDFHARFSAKGKTYRYVINEGEYDLFNRTTENQLMQKLDVEKMEKAASFLIGEHNFKNFTSKDEDEDNFVRNIYKIDIVEENNKVIMTFEGNGFMRYMVRMIVGTLLVVGLGKIDVDEVKNILENEERKPSQYKVAANGLTLVKVTY